jgi:DNA-binding transcriptional MerR regulator
VYTDDCVKSKVLEKVPRNKKKVLTLDYTPGCSFMTGAHAMQIGIVAKRVGLSVDAIRFYERNALMPRPARTQGGFRQYRQRDIETLAFIRRVQGLGFKLSEIRGLLSLRGRRMQPCAPVRRRLQSWLTCGRNWKTCKSWSANCSWRCAVAPKSCINETRIARSCRTENYEKRKVVDES